MKVAILTNGMWPFEIGGIQKHSYFLAKYLSKNQIEVEVYHAVQKWPQEDFSYSTYFSDLELKYLKFFEIIRPPCYKFPGHYLYDSYQLSKIFYNKLNKDVDIIYLQGFSGWYTLLQQKRRKSDYKNTIINFHGLNMFQRAASFKQLMIHYTFRPFVRWNLKQAHKIHSLGGRLTGILLNLKLPSEKIFELGIGITYDWIPQELIFPHKKRRRFVFIGRYERLKGINELHQVITQLFKENIINFQIDFVGPIPIHKQLNLEGIEYHGLIKEEAIIKEILQQSDILVCPSYSEGMPTVILEAMASGCAVIGTDVGAVSKLVDKDTGWLIEPGNKDALYQTMKASLNIPYSQLESLQTNAYEKVKKSYIWDQLAKDMILQFEQVLLHD